MEFKNLLLDEKDGYVIITLNRPDKLNALNHDLFCDIRDAVRYIQTRKDIFAMIVTGAGEKAFAAGADIQQLNVCDNVTGVEFSDFGSKIFLELENIGIPVIAAVNGFALGGGCELAMACHIRFASENAKFGQPEVNLGIIPGYGGTQRLPRLVGYSKAIEMIISGNTISAAEAKRIGLVSEVFPQSELLQKAEEFVKVVLSKGIISVKAALKTIIATEDMSIEEGLNFESKEFGAVCGTNDFKEGTTAFLQKRKAEFKNID